MKLFADESNEPMVSNTDDFRRERDCAAFNFLHASMSPPKFQTVRGVFTEGPPL